MIVVLICPHAERVSDSHNVNTIINGGAPRVWLYYNASLTGHIVYKHIHTLCVIDTKCKNNFIINDQNKIPAFSLAMLGNILKTNITGQVHVKMINQTLQATKNIKMLKNLR